MIERLTDTPYNEFYPIILLDDTTIAFISDKNGIYNIYLLNNNIIKPITNIFTGISQLTGIGNELFFTGFEKLKFGIYKIDSTAFNAELDDLSIAKWKQEAGLEAGEAIQKLFVNVTKLAPTWSQGFFHLGKYFYFRF